eukprot:351435-Rhodomonas_salina.3
MLLCVRSALCMPRDRLRHCSQAHGFLAAQLLDPFPPKVDRYLAECLRHWVPGNIGSSSPSCMRCIASLGGSACSGCAGSALDIALPGRLCVCVCRVCV